ARRNDAAKAAQLASMIPNYPVPSYVEYFQIKPQLFDSTGRARAEHEQVVVAQAIGDRLRNDYLLVLGAR
ncbi:lytic transglycosylase domain-containing protein, partial [Burkholderia cenocepacia]|nr:lytic transglycosylase domain-containing protein [Burkholderia cenocepacia]